jgi:hypothetical protein
MAMVLLVDVCVISKICLMFLSADMTSLAKHQGKCGLAIPGI